MIVWSEIIHILLTISIWYIFSVLTNTSSKNILSTTPFPLTLTVIHFLSIVLYSIALLVIKQRTLQRLTFQQFRELFPLSISHITTRVLHQVSLLHISISFTHTIKSLSPIFTIFLSWQMLGETYSYSTVLSVLPVVVGVTISSFSEVQFDLLGFTCAVGATLTFCWQSVSSKRILQVRELDELSLLFYTDLIGTLILFPISYLMESEQFLLGIQADTSIIYQLLFNAFCYFMQTLTALFVINCVSPLTYSLTSVTKRAFIIISSIIYFQTTITFVNGFGMSLSIVGVLWYTRTMYDLQSRKK